MYTEITNNKRKTWLLMIGFVVLVMLLGWFIGEVWLGDATFIFFVFPLSIGINVASYFWADKAALALTGAHSVTKDQEWEYFSLVENLCIATGLPMPKLYVIETPALNAFATGRDPQHASIAVTRGLLQQLEKRELEGVLAHELSHIKNYDIRLMTVVVVLVGTMAMLIHWGLRFNAFGNRNERKGGNNILLLVGLVLVIFAPLIANLIKFAVSRQREFLADASAAYITRYPKGLADALRKISLDPQSVPHANSATAHLFISNPFKNLDGMFSTHPPIDERIRRLSDM